MESSYALRDEFGSGAPACGVECHVSVAVGVFGPMGCTGDVNVVRDRHHAGRRTCHSWMSDACMFLYLLSLQLSTVCAARRLLVIHVVRSRCAGALTRRVRYDVEHGSGRGQSFGAKASIHCAISAARNMRYLGRTLFPHSKVVASERLRREIRGMVAGGQAATRCVWLHRNRYGRRTGCIFALGRCFARPS